MLWWRGALYDVAWLLEMGVMKSSELVIGGAAKDALGYGERGVACGCGCGAGLGLQSYDSEAHPRPGRPMPGSMLMTSPKLEACGRNSSV